MSIYQILCLFGIPTIFVTIVVALFKYLLAENKRNKAEMQAIKKGIQALLRAQMISEFNNWSEKGYAPINVRQNFENCWKQYHTLGANGVMDAIHIKFLELPTDTEGRR